MDTNIYHIYHIKFEVRNNMSDVAKISDIADMIHPIFAHFDTISTDFDILNLSLGFEN